MKIRRTFTLVEITLALGVVAIGAIAILALFPIGSNASRDAMAASYAADSADELLRMLEASARNDWANYIDPGGANQLSDTQPSSDSDRDNFDIGTSGTSLNEMETLWMDTGAADPDRFKVIRYLDMDADGVYDEGDDILDFEAIMVVWRSQVEIDGTNIAYDYATALNAEVSWPAAVPFAERQSERFYLEIFNRNPNP